MSLTSPPVLASSPAVEYTQRMNRVLDHIDRHLDTPLELVTLADVTHFSVFHFHRMLATWMGETLGDYVRRRRLEVAALCLAGYVHTTVQDPQISPHPPVPDSDLCAMGAGPRSDARGCVLRHRAGRSEHHACGAVPL